VAAGCRGQVAADAVGFPQHEVAIADHRHLAVRVERVQGREEIRIVAVGPELPVLQAQLGAQPLHLAHVDRRRLSQKIQHGAIRRSE